MPTHDKAKMSAENASEGNEMIMESTKIWRPITLTMVETSEVTTKRIRIVGISSTDASESSDDDDCYLYGKDDMADDVCPCLYECQSCQ